MSKCPACGTELKDEYGMIQCPSCSAFLFIDMDGNAFIGSEPGAEHVTEAPAESAPPAPTSESDEHRSPNANDFALPMDIDQMPNEHAFETFEPGTMPPQDMAPIPEAFSSSDASSSSEPPFTMPQEFDSSSGTPYEPFPDVPKSDTPSTDADPLGLQAYANSEGSMAKSGPLLFRILISGIDTKEIRESIREALEDSRFAWDARSILGRITKGELVIENVPPVKASILVSRIRRLPVKIRWEQYAIAQVEGP